MITTTTRRVARYLGGDLIPVGTVVAALLATATYAAVAWPADPAPLAVTPPTTAVCSTDADCAARDAAVAGRSGVVLYVDPARPGMTPQATPLPDGGVALGCGAEGTGVVSWAGSMACLPVRGA